MTWSTRAHLSFELWKRGKPQKCCCQGSIFPFHQKTCTSQILEMVIHNGLVMMLKAEARWSGQLSSINTEQLEYVCIHNPIWSIVNLNLTLVFLFVTGKYCCTKDGWVFSLSSLFSFISPTHTSSGCKEAGNRSHWKYLDKPQRKRRNILSHICCNDICLRWWDNFVSFFLCIQSLFLQCCHLKQKNLNEVLKRLFFYHKELNVLRMDQI